jgi:peptidyl-prolyl cis-trans isomerase B (cyclophilin B)
MKKNNFLKRSMVLFMLVFMVFAGGCSSKQPNKVESEPKAVEKVEPFPEIKTETKTEIKTEKGANDKNPLVTIEMQDGGVIKVELYPEIAPNTVRNFVSLIKSGYYDGLIFHRVIKGFMIQGGDPDGTGGGGPGYAINGEFSENEFENTLKHEKGVISMARTGEPNSAGSQFFIVAETSDNNSQSLDNKYAGFGKVTEGMEIVDKIISVETVQNDKPKVDQKMKKVTVDTFGVKYGEVEKVK